MSEIPHVSFVSFVARNSCPHLNKFDNLVEGTYSREYLYGDLNLWRIAIDDMTDEQITTLQRNASLCEEFVDVNIEEIGDIKIDGGYIRSALVPIEDEEDTDDPNPDIGYSISTHEKRLMEEIAECLDLDVTNNTFKSDQRHLLHHGSPREIVSRVLIDIILNTFDPKDWFENASNGDLSPLISRFRINVHCGSSNVIGESSCVVTLGLLNEDIEITRSYLIQPSTVDNLINHGRLVTRWGLLYYMMTNRLSVASLPSYIVGFQ